MNAGEFAAPTTDELLAPPTIDELLAHAAAHAGDATRHLHASAKLVAADRDLIGLSHEHTAALVQANLSIAAALSAIARIQIDQEA